MRRQAVAGMVTLALLLLMASDTMLAAAPPDIRNVRWGMTPSEVIAAETETTLRPFDGTVGLGGSVRVAGHEALLLYRFEAGRLVEVIYSFQTKHSSPNTYIEDYRGIQATLRAKYGTPALDDIDWYDSLYKDRPERWGMALSRGDARMMTVWFTERTSIMLLLSGDNYEIGHYLAYRDINKGTGSEGTADSSNL